MANIQTSLFKFFKKFGMILIIVIVIYGNAKMIYDVVTHKESVDKTSVSLGPDVTYIDKPSIKNSTLIYSGKNQKPVIPSNENYTVSITPHTNVGVYTATVQLKDTEKTRWEDDSTGTLSYKWEIKKANLKISANNNSITYGEAPSNLGVMYEGFVGNDDVSSLGGKLSYKYSYSRYNNVGTYTITPSGLSSNNYNIVYVSGKLILSPKKLSFTWSTPYSFTYDGNVKHVYATLGGKVNNDDVSIASYSQNSATNPGTYTAKVTSLSGAKSNNYTLSGSSNVSYTWCIVKAASNNTVTTVTEGTRTNKSEFVANLGDGTIVTVRGDFSNSIKLMVKSISSKEKVWSWIKTITEDVGISKEAFDIFFVNNSGNRVNTGKGTKISILSSDRKQDIEVYYIQSTGKKQKLKSTKEEYTVQFNMIENGYYTLLTSDQSLQLEKHQNGNITNKTNNNNNNPNNYNNKDDSNNNNHSENVNNNNNNNDDNTDKNSSDNKDKTQNNDSNQIEDENTNEDSENKDSEASNNTDGSQTEESTEYNDSDEASVNVTGDASQDESNTNSSKENNWLVTIVIILIILITVILFIIILKKQKKDENNIE